MGESVKVVRIGVVGAGAMGSAHVRTLSEWVPGARVTQVYDADPARAKDVASAVGAEAAATGEGLILGADVDAVLVAAPDPLHEELAVACLDAAKPVMCEKPLATTAEGSQRVVEAEVATGRRLLQVGLMRRYDPAFVELRAALAAGAVGEVRAAHCVHRNAVAHPTATSEGLLVNSMIHEFDGVPWLLDDPVVAVTVHAARVPAGAVQDVQVAVLETVRGAIVTVEVAINARYGYDVRTEVVGTTGTIALTPPYGLEVRRDGIDGRLVGGDFVARFADAYRIELAAWVAGIREGRLTGPSAWDGHVANLVAFAAVESLRGGGRVMVPQQARPRLYDG